MTSPIIEARKLYKSFGNVQANRDISFSVNRGELLCLFGENGAGKSTISACLTGLYPPDSGEILFKGKPLRMKSPAEAIRQGIGLVHQHFVLVPDFTVLENIVIGSEKSLVVQYEEAEKKLRQKLALKALTESEKIEVSQNEINSKLKEIENDIKLSKEKNIDKSRLKEAITDDLLQEKLFAWLEKNNTVLEKAPEKSNAKGKEKSSKKTISKKNIEKKSSKTPKS